MPSQRASDARRAELLAASIAATRVAADHIREMGRDLGRLTWHEKQSADFVSEVDTGAESRIRERLREAIPGAAILGEELSPRASLDAETVFVVDPVDGTTNFLHGFPFYAVSIGAVVDGVVETGVVLDVPRDEWFTATRGGGAFVNGARLSVSRIDEPSRSMIGTGFPFKHRDLFERYERQLGRIMRSAAGIRRAGSAALDLACVAAGRFDAFWELRLAPWDITAGLLLVREAGGRATDLAGVDLEPSHTAVVASNAVLHAWLLEQLTRDAPGERE
jgi:myo-inositol-1(or 4)-monophosphatase